MVRSVGRLRSSYIKFRVAWITISQFAIRGLWASFSVWFMPVTSFCWSYNWYSIDYYINNATILFTSAKSCFSSKVSSHWYDGPMSHSWELTLNLVCCDRDHRLRGGTTIWVTLPWLTPILQGWCHLGNSNEAQWICTHFLSLSSRPCKLIVRSAQWIFSVLHITINALQQHLMLFELEEAGIRVCDLDHIYPPSSTFD